MASRPFTAHDSDDAVLLDEAAGAGAGRINYHQLTVLAASVAEVVRSAGGWLYDRAGAGWNVSVLVDDGGDTRPLTILGATPLDGDRENLLRDMPRGGAVAVSAQVLRADAGVREYLRELARCGVAEVTVWGEELAVELGEPTEHQLSLAARAFKARAMAAAQMRECAVAATETLFDLRTEALRPLYPV